MVSCEDHAVPSRNESYAIDNVQGRSGGTRKEYHNPQADALKYPLDNFLTVHTGHRIYGVCPRFIAGFFKQAVVQVNQCAEFNNKSCVLSYTSIGDPA